MNTALLGLVFDFSFLSVGLPDCISVFVGQSQTRYENGKWNCIARRCKLSSGLRVAGNKNSCSAANGNAMLAYYEILRYTHSFTQNIRSPAGVSQSFGNVTKPVSINEYRIFGVGLNATRLAFFGSWLSILAKNNSEYNRNRKNTERK